MEYKSGVKTSEFWLTAVTIVVNILVITGVVGQGDADYLTQLATQVVAGVVAAVSLGTYIVSRTNHKNSAGSRVVDSTTETWVKSPNISEKTVDEDFLELG